MSNLRKLKAFESIDNGFHHVSVSRNDRLPSWEEIKYIREKYCDKDKFYVIVLPPEKHYVNVHQFCMHLWEVKSKPEIETWSEDSVTIGDIGGN